jgi:hypothetical protein
LRLLLRLLMPDSCSTISRPTAGNVHIHARTVRATNRPPEFKRSVQDPGSVHVRRSDRSCEEPVDHLASNRWLDPALLRVVRARPLHAEARRASCQQPRPRDGSGLGHHLPTLRRGPQLVYEQQPRSRRPRGLARVHPEHGPPTWLLSQPKERRTHQYRWTCRLTPHIDQPTPEPARQPSLRALSRHSHVPWPQARVRCPCLCRHDAASGDTRE